MLYGFINRKPVGLKNNVDALPSINVGSYPLDAPANRFWIVAFRGSMPSACGICLPSGTPAKSHKPQSVKLRAIALIDGAARSCGDVAGHVGMMPCAREGLSL
jgi:hypothetical protein